MAHLVASTTTSLSSQSPPALTMSVISARSLAGWRSTMAMSSPSEPAAQAGAAGAAGPIQPASGACPPTRHAPLGVLRMARALIDAALPRAAHRASWWETLRSPQEKMPQREACIEAGYIATRQADGKSVKFKRMPKPR